MNKTEKINTVLNECINYVENWDWDKHEDIDTKEKFLETIKQLDPIEVIAQLYHNHHADMVNSKMIYFAFVWESFSIKDWVEVIKMIDTNTYALYYFIPFCAEFLKIDITQIIKKDSTINEIAKKMVQERYNSGIEITKSIWEREILEEENIDPETFWNTINKEYEELIK